MKILLMLFCGLYLSSLCSAGLIYVDPPKEQQQVVYNYVRDSLRHDPSFVSKNFHLENLRIAFSLHEYFVDPNAVVAGKLLSATKAGGWKFLFFQGTNAVVGADGVTDPSTGKLLYPSFGTNVSPLEAIKMAEQLPQIKGQDYEVRLFAAGVFRGLWLHAKTNDIFIPPTTCYGHFQAFRPYTEAELIKVLQPYEQINLPQAIAARQQFENKMRMYDEAMTNYEKAHGSPRGPIKLVAWENPTEMSPVVEILDLQGISPRQQEMKYKARITYKDKYRFVISRIDILERISP